MTRYICEKTGNKKKKSRNELWVGGPATEFHIHSIGKPDHCVSECTYRCPTLSLSKQFLLHGLFIKLFTSFHIDSAMLNKIADKEDDSHYRRWVGKSMQCLQMRFNKCHSYTHTAALPEKNTIHTVEAT